MKVFICGPILGQDNNNIEAFQDAQRKAWAKNLECYAPPLLLKTIDPNDKEGLMRSLVKLLCDSTVLVTLPNWHEDDLSVALVEIARLMGIPVHSHVFLQSTQKA